MKPLGQLMLWSNLGSGKDSTDCLNRLACWELSGSPWLQNLLLAGKFVTSGKAKCLWVFFLPFFLFFMLRLLALGIKMMPWRGPLQDQGNKRKRQDSAIPKPEKKKQYLALLASALPGCWRKQLSEMTPKPAIMKTSRASVVELQFLYV